MTTATLPLDQIRQRIVKQETELQALRQEYAARQKKLDELTRRKQDLQNQIQQVEGQIQTLGGAGPAPVIPSTRPSVKAATIAKRPPVAVAPAPSAPSLSLPQLLPVLLHAAGRPLSIKELTEAVQRKDPKRAGDLPKQVSTRVGELVKKGTLRRTKDKAVTLPPNLNGQKPATSTAKAPAKTPSPTPAKSQGPAPAKPGREQPALPSVLTRILATSDKPLGGSELARRAQAAGYPTKSKDFASVVWTTLGKMDNIERSPKPRLPPEKASGRITGGWPCSGPHIGGGQGKKCPPRSTQLR